MWVRASKTAAAVVVALVGALLVPVSDASAGPADRSPRQPLPRLKIADASVAEADAGVTVLEFRVRLSKKPTRRVLVSYRTHTGTAAAVSDFVAASGTVRLTRKRPSRVITIEVVGDTAGEPMEQMYVEVSRVRGPARLVDALGIGQITDADPVTLTFGTPGSPGGYGQVELEPGGIVCTGVTNPCTHAFPVGTSVTLTASDNNTETDFAGWLGACAPEGLDPVCELVMTADQDTLATFSGE